MITEIHQIQKWFLNKQGVKELHELKPEHGVFEIPVGNPEVLHEVTISDEGRITIGDRIIRGDI